MGWCAHESCHLFLATYSSITSPRTSSFLVNLASSSVICRFSRVDSLFRDLCWPNVLIRPCSGQTGRGIASPGTEMERKILESSIESQSSPSLGRQRRIGTSHHLGICSFAHPEVSLLGTNLERMCFFGQDTARVNSPGGRLCDAHWCQCVDGKRRSLDADTIIPHSAQAGNVVLDALAEMAHQVIEDSARRPVAAMGPASWAVGG